MNDGWYRITYPSGEQKITKIFKNHSEYGSVTHLTATEGCILEEVVVMDKFTHQKMVETLNDIEKIIDQMGGGNHEKSG